MMKSNSLSNSKDPGRNHHSMLAGWVCAAARTKVWTISRVVAAPVAVTLQLIRADISRTYSDNFEGTAINLEGYII